MKKLLLIILDGWGIGNKSKGDAIYSANTPYLDTLYKNYPNSQLICSGEDVGLPQGQMGNSEVGHLNIGAGKIVFQDLVKISKDIETGEFSKKENIIKAFSTAKQNNSAIHFIGLLSDGGVHSHNTHLYALCDEAKKYGLEDVFIHAITDGRDTDPQSAYKYTEELQKHLENSAGTIATLIGRFYSMDRDKRWERIKVGYDLITKGIGKETTNILEAIKKSYENKITDEFIFPIIKIDENNNKIGLIKENDVVIFFNFRNDRARELTSVLTQTNFPELQMKTIPLHYFTMTKYDEKFQNINIIYEKDNLHNTLGEVLANKGKTQLRIAETEKYAHVTFFFSGGREDTFKNEDRILVPSPKVATYDLQPEMSAYLVTEKLLNELDKNYYDFICLNLANGDMVGHTGIYNAIIKAIETIDNCVSKIVEKAKEQDYEVLIIADHGNADYTINKDGSPNTAHSTNPVPCILISNEYKTIKNGKLADIAPTILKIMGIEKPNEMTGNVLIC